MQRVRARTAKLYFEMKRLRSYAEISGAALQLAVKHAERAWPSECCGFIQGPRAGFDAISVTRSQNIQDALHSSDSAHHSRSAQNGYAFDQACTERFLNSFHSDHPAKVIYHSHPNGTSRFSAMDQDLARDGNSPRFPVDHLVIAVFDGVWESAAQYAWHPRHKCYLRKTNISRTGDTRG